MFSRVVRLATQLLWAPSSLTMPTRPTANPEGVDSNAPQTPSTEPLVVSSSRDVSEAHSADTKSKLPILDLSSAEIVRLASNAEEVVPNATPTSDAGPSGASSDRETSEVHPTDTKPRLPLLDLTPAEVAYFEQTRKECDTEKTQKDRALQLAFVVAGGASVFGLTNTATPKVESSWLSLLLGFSLLVIITALMAWRRQKLRAQGYRWAVLNALVESGIRKESNWRSLESIIIQGVRDNIHGKQDMPFMFGLSFPIISLISWHSYSLFLAKHYISIPFWVVSIVVFAWSLYSCSRPTIIGYGLRDLADREERK